MIGPRPRNLEGPELPLAPLPDRPEKFLLAHEARAGAGDEDPPGLDGARRETVHVVVGAERLGQLLPIGGHLGRIEHDDVELFARLFQVVEDILVEEVDPYSIELLVLARGLERLLVHVDADHAIRARLRRRDRKSARVAAEVEQILPARKLRDRLPVFPLVAEESRLVAARKIDAEVDAVFAHDDAFGRSEE